MAKGIEKVAVRFCVETAIYWGTPTEDGYGGLTFADPVEIPCRWENKNEIDFGWKERHEILIQTKASVLVTQDLDLFGYLKLGSLNDFDSDEDISNPLLIENAFQIYRFDKIPMVRKSDEFVRTAWLYKQGK
jgi:hypothetical protein